MPGPKITTRIEDLIIDKLENNGIELVDLQYVKERGDRFIRIFIDTEKGVDLALCASVTGMVRDIIDSHEDIVYDHIEVSSPGIDRIIKKDKDFNRFTGHRVKIKTKVMIDNQKNFTGILKGLTDNNEVILQIDDRDILIPRELINVVRLFPDI
ncbi:MAG: ribosome maturation factor RimP [Syntrophomonadaceae bacterium]